MENDERDTGERAILNFGHTFGHAIEKLGGYSAITHGEAVSVGALILTKITEEKGLTEAGTAQRLRALLEKYSLPTSAEYPLADIVAATRGDKKSSGRSLSFVFLDKIGSCYIKKLPVEGLSEYFGA